MPAASVLLIPATKPPERPHVRALGKHDCSGSCPAYLQSGACMPLHSPAGSLSRPCPPPASAAAGPASLAAPAAAPPGSPAAARRAALCFQHFPAALQAHFPERHGRLAAPYTGIAASRPAPVPRQGNFQKVAVPAGCSLRIQAAESVK